MKSLLCSALMALAIFIGFAQADAAEIHDAAQRGDLAGVQQQLDSGVNVDLPYGWDKCTALIQASMHGHKEIVQLLIERGANVNYNYGVCSTALITAAIHGHTEIVQLLIAHGANVNFVSYWRETALILATFHGHTEIVNILIAHNADVFAKNEDGDTALILAAFHGHTEIVNILIAHNADVFAKNEHGDTAMDLAKNGEIRQLIEERINQRFRSTKSARKVA